MKASLVQSGIHFIRSTQAAARTKRVFIRTMRQHLAELGRFREMFERAPVGMHSIDEKGVIKEVNQRWLDIMGYTRQEVIGRTIFEFIRADQRQNAQARFSARLSGQALPAKEGDRIYITKAGKEIVVHTIDTVFRDAQGRAIGVQTSFQDETEIRNLRGALFIAEQQALLGRMAQAILHRLNNKTMAIKGSIELLVASIEELQGIVARIRDDQVPNAQEWQEIKRSVGNCKRQVEGLGKTLLALEQSVRQSLNFTKSEKDARTRVLSESKFVIELLDSRLASETVRLIFTSKGVSEEDMVAMPTCDFGDILEVLISNAIEAFPASSIDEKTIRVVISKISSQLIITIADNGRGIAEELKASLFDLPVSTTKGNRGTGIGCFIVGQKVRQAGGEIKIVSQENGGTTITVELPLVKNEAAATVPAAAKRNLAPREIGVWVVDDERPILDILSDYFTLNRFKVRIFESAASAIEALQSARQIPHIIVTDLSMPGINGQQFIEAIRRDFPQHDIRFILATGNAEGTVTPLATGLKVVVIKKPFSLAKLAELVITEVNRE